MRDQSFSSALHDDDPWEVLLTLFPPEASPLSGEALRDATALTIADFVGMKSPFLAGHPRRVSQLAESIATRLCLSEEEVDTARLMY